MVVHLLHSEVDGLVGVDVVGLRKGPLKVKFKVRQAKVSTVLKIGVEGRLRYRLMWCKRLRAGS